jgi:methyl-accepting chemotaxis protein
MTFRKLPVNTLNTINLLAVLLLACCFLISTLVGASVLLNGVIVLLISLSILLFILVRRSLRFGLTELSQMAQAIGDGNLDARVDLDKENEFGRIARNLSRALKRFQRILREVDDSAEQLNKLAEQTSKSSDRSRLTSDRLNEQSSQLATTTEEVSTSMSEVAQSIDRVNENAEQVSELSQSSNTQFQSLLERLKALTAAVSRFDVSFDKVEKSAAKIHDFVVIIENIAEQTNLLALNAAIEAARAGDQGRGFAVVADEVRALAHKTQQSTKDITSMTEELRALIAESANTSDEALESSKYAESIADSSISQAQTMLQMITAISDEIAAVRDATQEQNRATDSISANVQTLSELCDDASDQADSLHDNTLALSQLSERIVTAMDKLDDD